MAASERAAAATTDVGSAYLRLLADPFIQFRFDRAGAQAQPPAWLVGLSRIITSLWPVLRIVFLGALILVAAIAVLLLGRLVWRRLRQPKAKPKAVLTLSSGPHSLRPTAIKARATLQQADQLAQAQRFDEAAHVLLFSTIDDLQVRRPRAVRPALTSRDIAGLADLPAPAGRAFAVIAERVEESFFGGRPVDATAFAACRDAYARFAAPESWLAGARP